MLLTTTPPELNQAILDVCTQLNPESAPTFIPVRPMTHAIRNECYANVAQMVATNGGRIQYGWTIWMWAEQMIDAESHAVWVSPDGEIVDICDKPDGETVILFLCDDRNRFVDNPIDNRRFPLRDDQILRDFITAATLRRQLLKDNRDPSSKTTQLSAAALAQFKQVSKTIKLTQQAILDGKTESDPCPCGSGTPYRACCSANQ